MKMHATIGPKVWLAVLTSYAVAGCYKPIDPVMPAGDAAYAMMEAATPDPTSGRYTLRPGDKIGVHVFGEEDLSVHEVVIDNAGVVSLPLIGDVEARGRTASELARAIETAYGSSFLRDPQVNVTMRAIQERTIAVEGEVNTPGVFPYQEGQTLLSALALARSPTEKAKLDEVIVFRTIEGRESAARFDVRDIRGGRAPNLVLQPGDVVVVGYSSVRTAYLDAVRALPALSLFAPIT